MTLASLKEWSRCCQNHILFIIVVLQIHPIAFYMYSIKAHSLYCGIFRFPALTILRDTTIFFLLFGRIGKNEAIIQFGFFQALHRQCMIEEQRKYSSKRHSENSVICCTGDRCTRDRHLSCMSLVTSAREVLEPSTGPGLGDRASGNWVYFTPLSSWEVGRRDPPADIWVWALRMAWRPWCYPAAWGSSYLPRKVYLI